ncbi:hypothetical protein FM111_08600 [Brevundimonas diminuta 3F5N]|uniref:Uncharacterized protein n=1 Tax=Brevundimonas diminuta 3F5N TaxID=1255603 RepID=A0A1R4G1J9_BREDI|nr:hypothetical protein [Brevundimonas diminuta]SJM61943.1 hypothetical protein FM111_08600 [Brevundimonas diminuta 3F5N]
MIDHNIFDAWVEQHDVSDHTHELLDALASQYEAMSSLLTADAAAHVCEALRELDSCAWEQAYGTGAERLEQTQGQAPLVFFRNSLSQIDNLHFELGAFAHLLYCYASSGMVEPSSPDTSAETMKVWIEGWLKRANQIDKGVSPTVHPLDFFRLITKSANARWALDNNRPITGDQLAALSALAKTPGSASTGTYERVRKTVQNLIAEALGKSGGKSLEVGPDRLISATSAIAWLHEQAPDYFPSMWALPEPVGEAGLEDEIEDFVLVPVAAASLHAERKPFSPDVRFEDGYLIGARSESVSDYWEALKRLGQMRTPRFRHPRAHAALGPLACEDAWVRIPRSEIEAQLARALEPSDLSVEGPTADVVNLIEGDARFRPLAIGHSRKLFRFHNLRTGKAIAVESRKGPPVIYVARQDGETSPSLVARARLVDSAPSGRNSNLNSIPSFKNEELLAFRPASLGELQDVLDHLTTAS